MALGLWYGFVGVVLAFAVCLVGSGLKNQIEYWAWKWSLKRRNKKQ